MSSPVRANVLLPLGLGLGEGATATSDESFLFVDIHAGSVFEATLDGNSSKLAQFEHSVSAVALTLCGNIIVAGRQDISTLDGAVTQSLPTQASDIRLNDAKADPSGRFVGGTMAEPPREGAGSLWSFDENGVVPIVEDVTISNGLCWSADGSSMFYIDTPTQRIDCFDYDVASGRVANRRPHIHVRDHFGAPDGMTIDEEGGLWVALWGGSAVHRYFDGRLDLVIEVPTPFVTSVAIVGKTLIITTAMEPAPDDPYAGHVFHVAIGIGALLPHAVNFSRLSPSQNPNT